MAIIKNGGTIWGDQFARIVSDYIQDPVYFEVGAFNGDDVKLFCEVLPQTKAFAFEASPTTFNEYLKDKPYKTFNLAISNKDGESDFYESGERPTSSLLYKEKGFWKKEKVQTARLDTLISSYSLPIPHVIKIDTEGTTYEVLEGLGDILPQVNILYLETEDIPYWNGQKLHKEVVKLLKPYFKNTLLHDNNHQFDSIWISKSLL